MRALARLLGLNDAVPDRDTATVRRIAAELEQLPAEQARYLAAFAYVLTRVAHADLEVSDEELRRIERLVAHEGGLSTAQAALVASIAHHQAVHFSGTENYLVTRQLRELASREQCFSLVHAPGARRPALGAQDSARGAAPRREVDVSPLRRRAGGGPRSSAACALACRQNASR